MRLDRKVGKVGKEHHGALSRNKAYADESTTRRKDCQMEFTRARLSAVVIIRDSRLSHKKETARCPRTGRLDAE